MKLLLKQKIDISSPQCSGRLNVLIGNVFAPTQTFRNILNHIVYDWVDDEIKDHGYC